MRGVSILFRDGRVSAPEPRPVTPSFEELDCSETRMGDISLRRRLEPTLEVEVYEVKLGDEYLMSSLFTVAETALADLCLAALPTHGDRFNVLVGGLGLGYTAHAALRDARVGSLQVVEALAPVIDWHTRELLPTSAWLGSDPRCRFVHGDFFALVAGQRSATALAPGRFHAVLVDIDHTPRHLLDPSHGAFYEPAGLERLAKMLHPGGVFGLWSDDPPDEDFTCVLRQAFASCSAHAVAFRNPFTGGDSTNTVYVATTPAAC